MLTIKLSHQHAKHLDCVKSLINDHLLFNSNFNGEEFEIEIDDFTCIENSEDEIRDSTLLSALLRKIFNLIEGC
jgi:hypothetical protein